MADPDLHLHLHLHHHFHNLRSVADILRHSHSIFTSHLSTFLTLSLLIFFFRTSVETGTQLLTSFVDQDPTLHALLSRLHLSNASPNPDSPSHPLLSSPPSFSNPPNTRRRPRRRRNRPFLQLTRVGTLENDFFAEDENDERVLYGSDDDVKNATFVRFGDFSSTAGETLGPFSAADVMMDNGAVFKSLVRAAAGVGFDYSRVSFDDDDDDTDGVDKNATNAAAEEDGDDSVDQQYPLFLRNLDLGRRDTVALLFLVCFMSAAYGWVILGFLMTYCWVLGIVFVAVVNDLLGKETSVFGNFFDGCRLGMKRLSSFILLRWAIRDAFTQLLGLWYFGDIDDQYSFFRLFVRLKLMPFSIMSPWGWGFDKEIFGFVTMWFLIDASISFLFSVVSWVVIVNVRRRGGREMVKEGCHLLSTMLNQAIMLKCLEFVFSGSYMRFYMTRAFGKYVASYFQAAQEVFYMVAWLLFYLAARCQTQYNGGRVFGRRDLEGFADDFR